MIGDVLPCGSPLNDYDVPGSTVSQNTNRRILGRCNLGFATLCRSSTTRVYASFRLAATRRGARDAAHAFHRRHDVAGIRRPADLGRDGCGSILNLQLRAPRGNERVPRVVTARRKCPAPRWSAEPGSTMIGRRQWALPTANHAQLQLMSSEPPLEDCLRRALLRAREATLFACLPRLSQ